MFWVLRLILNFRPHIFPVCISTCKLKVENYSANVENQFCGGIQVDRKFNIFVTHESLISYEYQSSIWIGIGKEKKNERAT